MKAGYGKAGKQKTLSNFPTATTTTNYNYLWDTDSEGKVKSNSKGASNPTVMPNSEGKINPRDSILIRENIPLYDEIECHIIDTWQRLLGVSQVSVSDNFFDLGGDSIRLVLFLARVFKTYRIDISVAKFFQEPTVSAVAVLLTSLLIEGMRAQLPPITQAARDRPLSLSFAQYRLWFLAQLEGDSRAYHIPLGFRLTGELDRGAMHRALNRLISRHESLRTTFIVVDGEPVQSIAGAESGFDLQLHDLRRQFDAGAEVRRLTIEEATAAFDLEAGRLIRGRLLRLTDDEHVLLITVHHIVFDGWSTGVLTDELKALYTAFRNGQADPLPKLEIQYADYAVWQRQWLDKEVLQQQAGYWKMALAGAPAYLELPTDRRRPDLRLATLLISSTPPVPPVDPKAF